MRINFATQQESTHQETRKAEKGRFFVRLSELSTNSSEEILHSVRRARNVIHHDMNTRSCQLFMLIASICAVSQSLDAKTPEPGKSTPEPGKQREFIYVQRLVPRLYDGEKWTKEDNAALEQHIIRFDEATKSGQLILAGRTKDPGDKTFGIAIFKASDEAAARTFMKADPTVSAGLMTAELHPFAVAFEQSNPEPGKQQFIYVLRLVPRLHDGEKWTKEDNAALERHIIRFQEATKSGQLILAGRTKEPGDKTFGIAIFTAPDEAAARKFMESDPTVVAKLMTAELRPFAVAMQRKAP